MHTDGVVVTNGHGIQASLGKAESVHLIRGILACVVESNTTIELCYRDSKGESAQKNWRIIYSQCGVLEVKIL